MHPFIKVTHWIIHFIAENFIKQLSSYEIITPLRVNDFGESFPRRLHYRRRRRSLNDELSGLRLLYRIDAFGERFHLNLSADSSFIAPSYTVTHLGAEQSSDSDSHFHDPGDMRHCFFRGHVNAKSEHPAVFSLCTGLVSPTGFCFFFFFSFQAMLTCILTFQWILSMHVLQSRSLSEACKSVTRASVAGLMTQGSMNSVTYEAMRSEGWDWGLSESFVPNFCTDKLELIVKCLVKVVITFNLFHTLSRYKYPETAC